MGEKESCLLLRLTGAMRKQENYNDGLILDLWFCLVHLIFVFAGKWLFKICQHLLSGSNNINSSLQQFVSLFALSFKEISKCVL
jgi:hypothetical protein